MSNKLLFKPFVSWPNCVHLGLNNVDSISNKLLKNITLTQLLRFILVFLANQRFVFLICFTVFYKF